MIRSWLPIIGLLALAIVIWLGGPLIGIGPFRPLAGAVARLVTILLMVSIWYKDTIPIAIWIRHCRCNIHMKM